MVEGQTEETLARRLVIPHLEQYGWIGSCSILTTKRIASGGKFRGGVRGWERIRKEIALLLGSQFDVVTTMVDYYGFPADAPGMASRPARGSEQRVRHVERALADAVGDDRFVPHLTLHETEAWVFAAADALGRLLDDPAVAVALNGAVVAAGGPELVNDDPSTAPSKRIQDQIPEYQKALHGPLCIEDLGLARLRQQCPHLDGWLSDLEQRLGR